MPGKSHVQRTLVGYLPWGHKESDKIEQLYLFKPLTVTLIIKERFEEGRISKNKSITLSLSTKAKQNNTINKIKAQISIESLAYW